MFVSEPAFRLRPGLSVALPVCLSLSFSTAGRVVLSLNGVSVHSGLSARGESLCDRCYVHVSRIIYKRNGLFERGCSHAFTSNKNVSFEGKGGRTRAVHNGLCLGEQRTASQSRRDSVVALTPLARSAPPLPLLP